MQEGGTTTPIEPDAGTPGTLWIRSCMIGETVLLKSTFGHK